MQLTTTVGFATLERTTKSEGKKKKEILPFWKRIMVTKDLVDNHGTSLKLKKGNSLSKQL